MKTKLILTLCVAIVLGIVSNAMAQMKAGSPEDLAYTKIENEQNPDTKLTMLEDFAKQFPDSKVLPAVYQMEMNIYQTQKNMPKVNELGEKIIKMDPENVDVLLAVSRSYAMAKQNVDKAQQYAQRAVDAVAKKRNSPPPADYTDAQWKQYLDTLENSAKSMLVYAKSVKP